MFSFSFSICSLFSLLHISLLTKAAIAVKEAEAVSAKLAEQLELKQEVRCCTHLQCLFIEVLLSFSLSSFLLTPHSLAHLSYVSLSPDLIPKQALDLCEREIELLRKRFRTCEETIRDQRSSLTSVRRELESKTKALASAFDQRDELAMQFQEASKSLEEERTRAKALSQRLLECRRESETLKQQMKVSRLFTFIFSLANQQTNTINSYRHSQALHDQSFPFSYHFLSFSRIKHTEYRMSNKLTKLSANDSENSWQRKSCE